MGTYYLILGAIFIISMIVQNRLKSKFAHYSQVQLRNGMSGKEIAEKMLRDNNINDVQVISVPGQLTDHYNPANKTVNLSEEVYMQRNAAAAAVASSRAGSWNRAARCSGFPCPRRPAFAATSLPGPACVTG